MGFIDQKEEDDFETSPNSMQFDSFYRFGNLLLPQASKDCKEQIESGKQYHDIRNASKLAAGA